MRGAGSNEGSSQEGVSVGNMSLRALQRQIILAIFCGVMGKRRNEDCSRVKLARSIMYLQWLTALAPLLA